MVRPQGIKSIVAATRRASRWGRTDRIVSDSASVSVVRSEPRLYQLIRCPRDYLPLLLSATTAARIAQAIVTVNIIVTSASS